VLIVRQWILAVDRVVGQFILALACITLAVAALCGGYQIIARFVLQEPSTWTEVLTRTLMIWSVFLGLSAALRGGALLSVDLLYRTVARTRYLPILHFAITAATMLFLLVVVWYGWDVVYRVRFQNLAGLEIPISWAYAAIPVGAMFGMLGLLANYLDPKRGELETQQ
jgi:TRAP-type C4-dicarboxylate transport system permease small subunit